MDYSVKRPCNPKAAPVWEGGSFESRMPLENAVADGTVKRSKELSNEK